jgi:hypothetical protein
LEELEMPKKSGEDLKTVRLAPSRPQPKSRPIMHQQMPSGPKVDPMSPGAPFQADKLRSSGPSKTAADVVRAAENPGGIDGRQQVY